MKHLNFLSKSSSRSCGHSSVTLAATVGSPSAHRRGTMLRLLSVLVLVLTIGVGNVWGITVSDLSTSAATTITNGGQYVVATAYNGNYLTTGVSSGFGTATTAIGSAAIFTAHGTTSGFYLTCSAGRLVPASSKTFNAYDNGTTNNLSLNNAGKIQNSSNTSWTLQLNSNFRWYSSSQTPVYLYAVNTSSPSLSVSNNATSLAMGDAKVNGSGVTNNTLSFSGSNLTANATLSISGTNASMFTVSPTSVTPSSKTITNQTISVTYRPTSTGNHTAILTIASTGATSKEITLTGTGKYEVIWKCAGSDDVTTLVANGSRPTFPSTPTSCDSGEGASTNFYGWSTGTWSGKAANLEDSRLSGITIYTSAASMPTVSANGTTYHAVFCKGGSGSITINQSDFTGSDLYNQYSTQTITKTIGTTDYDFQINACIQSSMCQMRDNNNLSYIAIPALPGVITGISTTECANGSGSSYSGTLHFKHTKTRGNDDTNDIGKKTLSSVTSFDWDLSANTTYTSGYLLTSAGLRLKDLTITYGTAGTNYMTTCCTSLGSINGSVSVTNQRSLTLQWDKLSGVDGTTPYTITCKQGSTDAGTIGDVDLTGAKATCTVTGLACGTTYTFTITAHGDATHCDKTQENIQGATSDAMTLPALTYSSGLTAGGANITPSWASAVSHDGSVSYVSSNPSVVQIVNASTGEAKPVGAGTATITATYAQSTNNCEASKTSNTISVSGDVTVTFNANGGGGTMSNQSIPVSTATELTANAFTTPSSCKYFYGWATSQALADAETRAYTDGQSVTITAGMELFAIWKTYNYTVTKGTNEGAATFTLPANVDCGGTISITCAADGTHKGNPTISATEGMYTTINKIDDNTYEITEVSGDITVNISYAAKENYSITWKVNGEALKGSALDGVTTEVLEGGSITNLPAAPAGLDCAATFMGWSADEIGLTPLDKDDETDATRIAALGLFKNAASAPAIDGNKTFHAVFATGSSTNASLTQMVYEDDFAAGDKIVIIAENLQYGLYQESSSNYVSYWTTADNAGVPSINEIEADSKRYLDVAEGTADGTWKLGDGTIGYLYNSSSTNMAFSTENASDFTLTSWSDGTFTLEATQKLACRNDLTGGNQYKWRGSGANCDLTQGTGCSGTPSYNIYKYVEAGSSFNNYVTKCCKTWSDPTVTYNTYALVAGGDHATVTITGDQKGLTPTYSSSNTNVITVDAATGEVTPVGAGSATVTVTWAAANDYCEKVVTSSAFTVTGVAVITFKLNGGSVAGDVEKTQNVTTGEDATLTSLATLGYEAPSCKQFGGWAASEEDANAATPVVFKADEATINVSEATNLWAIWNTKTFAVADGTIDASVASHSFSNTVACGSDLTITCAATAAYKGNPTVTATGDHGEITINSATSVTIANVQSAIAVSIAYETAKANYAITWKVNGSPLEGAALDGVTTNVYEGDAIENLPTAPADNTLGCTNKFMGWSKKNGESVKKAASFYDDLFSDAEHAPEIEGETTFYAVFATQNSTPEVEHEMSFSRPESTDTYTTGYTFNTSGTSSKSGYYQDNTGTVTLKLYHTSNAFFTSAPANLSFTANIGAGNNNLDFENPVYARLLNQSGEGIGNAIEITSRITSQSGDTYTPTLELTGITSAYGIMLYHEKESGQNIRYYSFSLSYTTGGTTTTDYVTECAAVEAPTFTPAEGEYSAVQTVTIASATDGAKVYYNLTTDGTTPADPTAESTEATSAITIDQNTQIKAIAIKDEVASAIVPATYTLKVATPTISDNTSFVSSTMVTIEATGADAIYYTDDNSDPASSGTKKTYSGSFAVDANTTIKAIAVKENWTSSEVAEQVFTKVTPMTVAEALDAIGELEINGTIANQYVKGIISHIDSYNDKYNSITYWISDDGTDASQLEVYSGWAGVVKENFEAVTDLTVGEEVIINGTLKRFRQNNTSPIVPEFDKENVIVAYRPYSPIAWSTNAYTAEIGGSNSFPTLSGTDGLTISYSSSDETVATISADGTTYDLKKVGSTTITATSEANASYVATTKSYTLTVEEAVVRYSLSYEKDGGTSDATDSEGETETNLPDPLPTITKAGSNFGGWYLESTFENKATAGAALTENTTLYAQWLEPFTVAQALTKIAALDDNGTTEAVYLRGEVTDVALTLESGNTATYIIKDAGESNSLKVYKGKGKKTELAPSGENITEASYLQEGDAVVLYGQLMKYVKNSTTTPEVTSSFIYSFNRPTHNVTGVTLPNTANVRAGKTVTLTAEIAPANATNKNVTWSVKSGDAYAEVSAAGVVTGLAEGTAVIEVETEDGGFKAQCTVTVAAGIPTFTEDDHEWIKVSNASKLVAGKFYVIAESASGKTATTSISSNVMGHVTSTFSSDKSVIASGGLGDNTAIFELGGNSTDGWTLYEVTDEENTGYFSGANASSFGWSESAAITPISFDANGNAVLGNASGYRLLYNVNSPRFKTYNSSTSNAMLLPQLYMWAQLSHAVTFDANGGDENSVPDVERTDEGSIIIPATVPTHSDVTKEFAGWYETSAPNVLYNDGDEFSTNVDVTLYAKWNTVPTYTVTYVPGGQGTVPAVASYRAGQKVQVVDAELSNAGYSFAGWTVKDADQNVLPLDEENKFTMPASNVTITAVWSRISSQKWKLVKQGDELVIDAEYVIAYNSNTVQKALGAISSNIGTAINVTIDGDYLKGSEAMKVLTLKKGKDDENYAFKNGDNYLTWSSGKTLNESTTLDNASSWMIEIDENNKVDIRNVGTTARYLQYNASSPRFACYENTQQKVLLFKKVANLIVEDEQTKTAAQVDASDITVKENGKLTINVDADEKEIGDITVEDGGELIITGSKHIEAKNVYLSSTMASGTSSQLSGAPANLDIKGDVFFDITLGKGGTNQQWHAFTVPFEVDVMSGIYNLDNEKLTNEVNYAIMEYHGDERAKGNYGWKKIRTTLVPGTFYIMATDGYRTTYRFKKKAGAALVAANSKPIYEYPLNGGTEADKDNGWNGLGNPNLFYGKVNLAVQVLDPESYTYVTKTANSTNFVVGTPFFYQAAEEGTMVMATADAGANYAPARIQANEIKDIPVSFGNEEFTDYLYVSANEDALNTYETGKDLAKMTMTNTPKVAQIFGKAYESKLSMVYTPLVNNQAEVALELYAPQAGEYTIGAPSMDNADLYLTYEGAIIWNLSIGAYEIELAKGTTNGYGLLLQAKAPQVTTGVDQLDNGDWTLENVQKVIIDEHVFILRGGQMYDVTGKAVK